MERQCQRNYVRNHYIIKLFLLEPAKDTSVKRLKSMSDELLRLVGDDDWSDESQIVCYLSDSDIRRAISGTSLDVPAGADLDSCNAKTTSLSELDLRFQHELTFKVATCIKSSLLHEKPAPPAESRWLGLTNSAAWYNRLILFKKSLVAWLAKSLTKKKDTATAAVDADNAAASSKDWSVQVSARQSLFRVFCEDPTTPFCAHALITMNWPVRMALCWTLKHDVGIDFSADGWASRYSGKHSRFIHGCASKLPFVDLAAGKVTASALTELAETIALQNSVLHELAIVHPKHPVHDQYKLVRRLAVAGASSIWWRVHKDLGAWPAKLFRILHPDCTVDEQRSIAFEFLGVKCIHCLNPGFSRPLHHTCNQSADPLATFFLRVKPLLVQIAPLLLLAIFHVETGHRALQSAAAASSSLGRSQDFES